MRPKKRCGTTVSTRKCGSWGRESFDSIWQCEVQNKLTCFLANGAGLTMTTMDVIRHHGGRPANFCEIGGEAYTLGKAALELVLAKSGIKSLVVNFCGAFARCDVMVDGLLTAWDELQPDLPVFFSIAGTGDREAIAMLRDRLGVVPYPNMDAASRAAVEAP